MTQIEYSLLVQIRTYQRSGKSSSERIPRTFRGVQQNANRPAIPEVVSTSSTSRFRTQVYGSHVLMLPY